MLLVLLFQVFSPKTSVQRQGGQEGPRTAVHPTVSVCCLLRFGAPGRAAFDFLYDFILCAQLRLSVLIGPQMMKAASFLHD